MADSNSWKVPVWIQFCLSFSRKLTCFCNDKKDSAGFYRSLYKFSWEKAVTMIFDSKSKCWNSLYINVTNTFSFCDLCAKQLTSQPFLVLIRISCKATLPLCRYIVSIHAFSKIVLSLPLAGNSYEGLILHNTLSLN